jgi:hypothetical protein
VVSVTDSYGRILGFLERSRYFSIKYLLSCTHEAEWTPFQTQYFFFCSARERSCLCLHIYLLCVLCVNYKQITEIIGPNVLFPILLLGGGAR